MAAENSQFTFGGVNYPLVAATTNSLLLDADPSLYWLLAFSASVLNTYLSTRLVAESALCEAPITAAVKATANYDPIPFLMEHAELTPPVLGIYRVRETFNERTVTWDHEESDWNIVYILPAFQGYGGTQRIKPIQHAVGQVLRNRFSLGYDPSYLSGAKILGAGYANLETIDIMSAEYGRSEDGQGMYFETMILKARVRERVLPPVAGTYDALAGVDTNMDLVPNEGATMADVVVLDTDTSP